MEAAFIYWSLPRHNTILKCICRWLLDFFQLHIHTQHHLFHIFCYPTSSQCCTLNVSSSLADKLYEWKVYLSQITGPPPPPEHVHSEKDNTQTYSVWLNVSNRQSIVSSSSHKVADHLRICKSYYLLRRQMHVGLCNFLPGICWYKWRDFFGRLARMIRI